MIMMIQILTKTVINRQQNKKTQPKIRRINQKSQPNPKRSTTGAKVMGQRKQQEGLKVVMKVKDRRQ